MMRHSTKLATVFLVLASLAVSLALAADPGKEKKKKRQRQREDPYAEYVWPPPPDPPRIKLQEIFSARADVETRSRFQRILLGASPHSRYDWLVKPFAVVFDGQGRIVVSDPGLAALIRFDREERKMDVLGTRGALRLKLPLGLASGPEDAIYVADAGLQKVVAFDPEGKVLRAYGAAGELVNPTDSALSPDGSKLYVADSKAHQILVFDAATAALVTTFGRRGEGEGELAFPTSLAFGPDGSLFVVDQLNSRVQVFTGDGEYLDQFGTLGVGFGNFVRPKDVAVDEVGFVYVTDNAYNNLQLFAADFTLLTFIGEGGLGPGQFHGASGVAVRGAEFAVVDQLGHRVQVFSFLVPKEE